MTHIATSCGGTVTVWGSTTPLTLEPVKASTMSHFAVAVRLAGRSACSNVMARDALPSSRDSAARA
jgi:hypothetical protein